MYVCVSPVLYLCEKRASKTSLVIKIFSEVVVEFIFILLENSTGGSSTLNSGSCLFYQI